MTSNNDSQGSFSSLFAGGRRLSVRQAEITVLIAFLLGFSFSLGQIYLDYRSSKANVSDTIAQVMQSISRPAAGAVLNLDEDVGRELLQGIFEYRAIRKATIFDESNRPLATLERDLEPARLRWLTALIFGESQRFSIPLDTRQLVGAEDVDLGNLFESGSLEVFVDTYYSGSDFLDRAWVIIVSGVLRNLLLALCLLWFFHYYLTKPILNAQAELVAIDAAEPGSRRISAPRRHEKDEFGELINAINRLLVSISSNIEDRIRHAEDAARLSVALSEGEKREEQQRIYGEKLARANEELRLTMEELAKSHEELEEANDELNATTDELLQTNQFLEDTLVELRATQASLIESEKMAALGQLVGGVAHEINTPVGVGVTAASTLISIVEEFRRRIATEQVTKKELDVFLNSSLRASQMIQGNLSRAASLIDNFKQVAVDQSGEQHRRFKLREYLLRVLDTLSPKLEATRLEIEVHGLEDEDIEWLGFPGAYAQVISNLVMNSLTHAFDPGQTGVLKFEFSRHNGDIQMVYSDSGRGMTTEVQKRAFEPFFTTNRQGGGTGLGLQLVYNIIVQKFGGQLRLESEPGAGSRFIMRWPLQRPVQGAAGNS